MIADLLEPRPRRLSAQQHLDQLLHRRSGDPADRLVHRGERRPDMPRDRRIVEADGQPTPNLDAFMKAVAGREDRASVRLKTVTWNEAVEVITLKLDKRYWPSYELRRTANGWQRTAWE